MVFINHQNEFFLMIKVLIRVVKIFLIWYRGTKPRKVFSAIEGIEYLKASESCRSDQLGSNFIFSWT